MTSQGRNQGTDQKKGSADIRSTGEVAGMPGHNIADGLSTEALTTSTSGHALPGSKPESRGAKIPEQSGCGPNVTDYPGLSDDDDTRQ
jgi:hypothetical protein